jgi:hypothetical protein
MVFGLGSVKMREAVRGNRETVQGLKVVGGYNVLEGKQHPLYPYVYTYIHIPIYKYYIHIYIYTQT